MVTTKRSRMWAQECEGSPTPTRALEQSLRRKSWPPDLVLTDPQEGQKWENFLKPGRQKTRQLAHQDPQKKQQMAKNQPSGLISSLTVVNTCWAVCREFKFCLSLTCLPQPPHLTSSLSPPRARAALSSPPSTRQASGPGGRPWPTVSWYDGGGASPTSVLSGLTFSVIYSFIQTGQPGVSLSSVNRDGFLPTTQTMHMLPPRQSLWGPLLDSLSF